MAGWRIPLFSTHFTRDEMEAVQRPLRNGWLTMGEEVLSLEEELRECTGARHAIALSSCTAALHLAALALDVGPGDEVIAPALTFVASASAPRAAGASIRLCDITSSDNLSLDPASVAAALTPRTKALVAVHYAGFACDLQALGKIAAAHRVAIIEDCAHALFTHWHGRVLGTFGRVGCFSFYSNKNATCGEGGALITNDDVLAERVRLLRSHGMTQPTLDRHRGVAFSYDVALPGFNYRLDEIRAALLRVQLKKLPAWLARRRELFSIYKERLASTPIHLPFTTGRHAAEMARTAVHILPVLLPQGTDRLAIMQALKEEGIQTSIHYPPVHRFKAYASDTLALPVTDDVAARELTLPLYPEMCDSDVDVVTDALARAVEKQQVLV